MIISRPEQGASLSTGFRDLAGIYVSGFCVELAIQGTQPLSVLLFASLGASPSAIGLLLALTGMAPMFFALPLGRLADRVGILRLAIAGTAMCALGLFGFGASTTTAVLVAFLMLSGLGYASTSIAYQSLLAGIESRKEQLEAFGWLSTTSALGQTLGPAIAGVVADWYRLPMAFSLAALVAGVSIGGLLGFRRAVRTPQASRLTKGPNQSWWTNRALGVAIWTIFIGSLALSARVSFLPLYFSHVGYSAAQIGLLVSVLAAASIVIRSRVRTLAEQFGSRSLMTGAFLIGAPAFFLIPWAQGMLAWSLSAILIGISTGVLYPLTMAMTANAVPAEQHGFALGLRFTALRFGSTLCPLLLGIVAGIGGLDATMQIAALLCMVGAFGCIAARSGWDVEAAAAPQ